MTDQDEIVKTIDELLLYHDCIAWNGFSDRGNPCYSPYNFGSEDEVIEDANTTAAVKIVMKKGLDLHCDLAKVVATDLGATWVTYDWLLKIVSRILAGSSYEEIHSMLKLSLAVKAGMKERGLTEISKIEEAFA